MFLRISVIYRKKCGCANKISKIKTIASFLKNICRKEIENFIFTLTTKKPKVK